MKRSGLVRKTPMSRGKPKARPFADLGTKLGRTPIRPKRPKNAPSAAESAYMGAVAALGCAVCRHLGLGETPAIVHHQRTGQGAMRASHYRTCPLCPPHHQHSGYGVHDMGREQFAAMYGISEVELVEQTRALLAHLLPETERA